MPARGCSGSTTTGDFVAWATDTYQFEESKPIVIGVSAGSHTAMTIRTVLISMGTPPHRLLVVGPCSSVPLARQLLQQRGQETTLGWVGGGGRGGVG